MRLESVGHSHRRVKEVFRGHGVVPIRKIALVITLLAQRLLESPNEHAMPVQEVSGKMDEPMIHGLVFLLES